MTIEVLEKASGSRSKLKVIDCDVHPTVRGGLASVYPYMPDPWKQRFMRKRAEVHASALTMKYAHPNGLVVREDTRTPKGDPGGSDPEYLIADLLEGHGIEIALLNCLQTGALCSALATTDESIVLATAFNEFFLDQWLPVDKRLRYVMAVPSQDPQAAAAEIRRIGKHPQIAAVFLPPLSILMGNRYWWPVYEAAQELALPILVHVTGTDSIYYGPPMSAGGIPDSYVERYVTLTQAGESNVNSLVFSGTFEKFPELKVVFVEYGFLWVLPLLWRMDRTWRQLRHETPWVKKSPIDYVHDHIRFTTQPLDEPRDPHDLDTLVRLIGIDQLCFSTDYPHWDNDMPGQSLRTLPMAERQKIFHDNAAATFRLS